MNAEAMAEKVRALHGFLDSVQARCVALTDAHQTVDGLVTELVAEQAQIPAPHRLPVQFAQFIAGTWAANQALESDDLSACGDWVGWSLSETINDKHLVQMQVDRLRAFWTSDLLSSWPGFGSTFVGYLTAFYYYARRRAAMPEVGMAIWPVAMEVLSAVMGRPPHRIPVEEASLVSTMLAWAAISAPDWARQLTPRVEGWVNDAGLPIELRAYFCVTLSTAAGRFSKHPLASWANRSLDEFADQLVGEQKVQVFAAVFDANDDGQIDAILAAMEDYQAPLRQAMKPMAFTLAAAATTGLIQPFITRCLDAGRADVAVRGISRWYQGPAGADAVDPSTVLLISPFGEVGYVAGCNHSGQQVERDSQALLVKQTRESNAFLGAALTVAQADNSNLELPDAPGIPDIEGDSDWFTTLHTVHCPEGPLQGDMPTSQLTLQAIAHPVQAIQQSAWGMTWPIAASLSAPAQDRQPSKVVLWSGGGSLTEEMELTVVRAAFEAAGAIVETFSPEEGAREAFLAAYQDPTVDVFWVASHGEFDHWSPRDVKLQIARDQTYATLEELLGRAPAQEGRRLLVLNICDGARFEETGLVPRVGLAPGLATAHQATISHLWPVLGFPSAAFGAYLAHHLAAGAPFFESFRSALTALPKTSPAIADELETHYGQNFELFDRLRVGDKDFAPLQLSGSAAFFQ